VTRLGRAGFAAGFAALFLPVDFVLEALEERAAMSRGYSHKSGYFLEIIKISRGRKFSHKYGPFDGQDQRLS
jgi:hypothetical protein